MIHLLPVFMLLLTLYCTPLHAQQQGTDNDTEKSEQEAPASAETNEPSAPAQTAPGQTNDSPFDYRSSEEISEDLSVSFPVDI
ncbi:MAG: hypothetical protein V7700_18545 [Halioglobus sp.]